MIDTVHVRRRLRGGFAACVLFSAAFLAGAGNPARAQQDVDLVLTGQLIEIGNDADGDYVPDDYELANGLDPTDRRDAVLDPDNDGANNLEEYNAGTDPRVAGPDSDGDGMVDAYEVAHGLSAGDPSDARGDLDHDGASNLQEFLRGTDPEHAELDETCTVVTLNRISPVDQDGNFALRNVPVATGFTRVRVVCMRGGETLRGSTAFLRGIPNGDVLFDDFDFGPGEVPIPVSLALTSPSATLSGALPSVQLTALGKLVDGAEVDLTASSQGMSYQSSNPAIATVSADGLVTGVTSGRVLVTATYEGVAGAVSLLVGLTGDTDGDGLPDDYERLNGFNPGGVNLTRLPGTQVRVSSAASWGPARLAIDGDLRTSWYTASGDAANRGRSPYVEVELPADQRVAQVRLFGNREYPKGYSFLAGFVQAFDAAGNEVFNSGPLAFPAPSRDLSVPLDRDGVRRVRFTSTLDESNSPSLGEIQIISRPGGTAFDPALPGDAAADFDLDGLTNLQEFARGTNPFAADTDADGFMDGQEIGLGSDPVRADTDGDGLADGLELFPTTDSDGDGIANLLDPDSDNDGLPDGLEVRLRLSPLSRDTNGNNVLDGAEDADFDGLSNLTEVVEHTDPARRDSDGDGIEDGQEITAGGDGFVTNPRSRDTDGDGMEDGWEVRFGFDPTNASDASLDADFDGLSNLEESRRGSDPYNPDANPPAVSLATPLDGATGVPVNQAVILRFTEPLLRSSVVAGVVRLFAGTAEVQGTAALSSDQLVLVFTPLERLAPFTDYLVRVAGVRDLASNPMGTGFSSGFTTGELVDTEPPMVVGTSPDANLAGVPVNAPVTVYFSEPMSPASLTPGNFRVHDQRAGEDVPALMIQVEPDGRSASFIPQQPLGVGRLFSVLLLPGIRDAAGNPLPVRGFLFTTGLRPDEERPQLLASSPPDGAQGVPSNAVLTLRFDEAVDAVTIARGISVETGGEPVEGSIALSDGNRLATFTPAAPFEAGARYRATVSTAITDLIGHPLANPLGFTFDAGSEPDGTAPFVTAGDPPNSGDPVARDVRVAVTFSETVNPATVNESTFRLTHHAGSSMVEGLVRVAPGGRSAAFVPRRPLAPGAAYTLELTAGVTDLAGQPLQPYFSFFLTAQAGDTQAPAVVAVSPPAGASGVPTNALVTVKVSEAVSAVSVGLDTLALRAGSSRVPGGVTQSDDRTLLTFTPSAPLAPATSYQAAVTGFTDLSGNPGAGFTFSFTTSADPAADGVAPAVLAVFPPTGATAVDPATPIVWTFSEPVDPLSVSSRFMPVVLDTGGALSGTYRIEGPMVTFTPVPPLPALTRVRPLLLGGAVRDLAGNTAEFFESFFDTGGSVEEVPPQLLMVTPVDGATDIGPNVPVVFTFSEPISPLSIDDRHFGLLAEGEPVPAYVATSDDGRTISLFASLPPAAEVTVVAAGDVTDLSGNRLAYFQSRFSTASSYDGRPPSVVAQRPGNGAVGVAPGTSLVLFTDERLDPATLSGALLVAQNGQPVSGSVQVTGDSRIIEFVPEAPWPAGAPVEVFLTSDARDVAGNRLAAYQGSFRALEPTTATTPRMARTQPAPDATGLPLNGVVELELNEPLNPATVTSSSVLLIEDTATQAAVPAALSLEQGGRRIRVQPLALLNADTPYRAVVTASVRDLDGQSLSSAFNLRFRTGGEADTAPPAVLAISPPNGQSGVGLNAQVQVVFDEPVDPLSVDGQTILLTDGTAAAVPCTMSFSDGNRMVSIVPHAPLMAAKAYSVQVSGVLDPAGNPVAPASAGFTTGTEPDFGRPQVQVSHPSSYQAVPVNTALALELDEPVAPTSVRAATVRVRDLGTNELLAGSYTLSNGGRRISFVPAAALPPSGTFAVELSGLGLQDLAGNFLDQGDFYFFTTEEPDTTPPEVTEAGPRDGWAGVPVNGRVAVRFDEPLSEISLEGAVLTEGGREVPAKRRLEDGGSLLLLIPVVPLAGNAACAVAVAGVRDLAGNALASPFTSGFTTETRADLAPPAVAAVVPRDHAGGVDVNTAITLQLSERLDPASVTGQAVQLSVGFIPAEVAGTLTLAADARSLAFVPAAPLTEGEKYTVTVGGDATDLTGRRIEPFTSVFRAGPDTVAPEVIATNPPAGAAGVVVSAPIAIRLSEEIDPATVDADALRVFAAGVRVPGAASAFGDQRIVFYPEELLGANVAYSVLVGGFTDYGGNPVVPSSFTFTTSAADDQDPPLVTSFDPANGSSDVPVGAQVVINFSEPIDATSVDSSSIDVQAGFSEILTAGTRGSGRLLEGTVPIEGSFAVSGSQVIFTPRHPLPAGTRIAVRVESGIIDVAGNPTDGGRSVFFTAP